MYIFALIIISFLSFFKVWDTISSFIVRYKKYFSVIIYVLCFASFLFLLDPYMIHETWEIAISLLWFLLWLPILKKVFDFKLAWTLMIFRKEIWILMWVMAIVHSIQYFMDEYNPNIFSSYFWLNSWILSFYAWGFLALIITIVLTITSNIYSMRLLWRKWKLLHRTVYVLLIFVLLHVSFIKMWWSWFSFMTLFTVFIPFILYFTWKILEWKKIKLRHWKNIL